ncbi:MULTISPECIES: DUF961 family protein [unclassified Enterococcus]|uniref:DUF961 family protein n=1 Tax=unclassified Enterococcus TaxID=2608891 RepID=UPI0015529465|nr:MULTISPECIES: DUF961 family protein [unclassified Enterococcus]MBS7576960.1 DUF961 family protein [Enterococcus sp. MMGLQ5-2]MBS7584367.1 DUF961 family protein [Enterococcus sp. MMGLQ5-1]NPD12222.1 DUF961 family protein [Enterococcus sp. MMGLQ5-1]NPD36794.1 DUF961 family protein [Enterococcus sp. MMGLQ5-2]
MAKIKVENSNLTPLLDFKKTFGRLFFLEQLNDKEARQTDGERGEAVAVRFEVLSETQGAEFTVSIDLADNPLIDLSSFKMDDEIELVEGQVFEYNINNNATSNIVVALKAIDVKKIGKLTAAAPIKNGSSKIQNDK